jgi:hypothetical protein
MLDDLIQDYARMIADGAQWLIVSSDHTSTVQPLTDDGYDALCHVLLQLGATRELLVRMGRKRKGYYCQAVPLEHGADELARFLLDAGLTGAVVDTRKLGPAQSSAPQEPSRIH